MTGVAGGLLYGRLVPAKALFCLVIIRLTIAAGPGARGKKAG